MEEDENPIMVEGSEAYQTVTLVPSEAPNGDVSYVLVVQEDNKALIKVDQVKLLYLEIKLT